MISGGARVLAAQVKKFEEDEEHDKELFRKAMGVEEHSTADALADKLKHDHPADASSFLEAGVRGEFASDAWGTVSGGMCVGAC